MAVNVADYSLTEISRIVESNDTKILSFFMNPQPEKNSLEIVMKLDREDLSSVLTLVYCKIWQLQYNK